MTMGVLLVFLLGFFLWSTTTRHVVCLVCCFLLHPSLEELFFFLCDCRRRAGPRTKSLLETLGSGAMRAAAGLPVCDRSAVPPHAPRAFGAAYECLCVDARHSRRPIRSGADAGTTCREQVRVRHTPCLSCSSCLLPAEYPEDDPTSHDVATGSSSRVTESVPLSTPSRSLLSPYFRLLPYALVIVVSGDRGERTALAVSRRAQRLLDAIRRGIATRTRFTQACLGGAGARSSSGAGAANGSRRLTRTGRGCRCFSLLIAQYDARFPECHMVPEVDVRPAAESA